ncbi:MAG: hypothetical protein A2445_03310 [Candidatus Jacksonbacteria bacterium RIFOXYC2_FULL_44_29]|nr:MAG: hypothetical protein UW45_C0032G0008 [Parcubacteria group bacterium GW2011_GWC2_44_22]OGY75964.1 MAG: hypothetical protein A2240_05755 [Candidatus Jacksonbacteria bacterium RIFOXYA2_FULL_43_12]OGY77004.1 MAG: hypothetical protein A2295_05285 [Candidatus Jacksonbacteria bacterium RIFOXYB2_FULL_44_15]OGY78531.1 MAG: hypothetical protein A2550_02530 [Candidatus Jacksonbacteria bacterium RIFOXYD2_FULL_43_21]OGY79790.1 MAG: hypothetical protein A2445_03310 [Candidatus Jacksonbacteria bacteri
MKFFLSKKIQVAKNDFGFTIVEILVVMAVLLILSFSGIFTYQAMEERMNIDTATESLISVIQLARSKTIASENAAAYGVYFESDKYVLFKGDAYDPAALDNVVHLLPAGVEIYDISLAGGPEALFKRLSGGTDNVGNVSLRLINHPTTTAQVNVLASGEVGLPGMMVLSESELTDSRHLHLDLGWSIQTASTMTFTFLNPSNPDFVQNIDMTNYFNVGQTEFSWSGTTLVGGKNQSLKVHTHVLDGGDTLLCVHRDRRLNNKAVNIEIDGKGIVSYVSAGTPTVGIFGGVMQVQ